MNYVWHLLIYLSIYSTVALGLNLIVGYLGRLSMAHAGFVALGAYAYALGVLVLRLGFVSAVVLAALIGAVASLSLSLPAMRFRGDFFVMITLTVQALIFGALYHWYSAAAPLGTWQNLTNGPFGVAGLPKPVVAGIRVATVGGICALSVAVSLLCAALVYRLTNSPWGRLLLGARDDELALRNLGKNVRALKMQVFALGCALASVGGALYVSYVSYVDPNAAALEESILLLCMVCVGGSGNFRGPLIGALVLVLLPEALRLAPLPGSLAANFRMLAYGLLLLAIVHVRPQGIAGEYRIE